MKNYRKSDYALNKFSEGIVYQFSDRTLEISMADYLRDNPDKTEADFLELKALSDEIYLEQVRLETAQGNKTVSMTELEYPGQIKVNVIRESRVIDYAK